MINIAELLKNAPKGMTLYSLVHGEVEFAEVMDTGYMPIRVMKRGYGLRFDKYGRYMGNEYPDAECVLFPSKDCRTWEGWKATVEPMFKVGDSLQSGSYFTKVLSINLEEGRYYCDNRIISFEDQDSWHLIPKRHYDISNFQPFDNVLVRDGDKAPWRADFFEEYDDNFYCFRSAWEQCIPFNNDTKHLLGTTEMCPEKYINW